MKKKKDATNTYHFANAYFDTLLQGGVLLSVKPGQGEARSGKSAQRDGTQFVLPGQSFGAINLAWEQGGKPGNAVLGSNADWRATAPQYTNRLGRYCAVCEAEPLSVTVQWELSGDALLQKVQYENISDAALRLMDIGYSFYSNTEFKFGVPASDKVIGHHFISGHGSRLLFVRCDGQGPYLLIIPERGTQLEYFEQPDVPGAYTAYALSAQAVKKAEESRMPTPGSYMDLSPGETVEHHFRWLWASDNDDTRRRMAEHGLIDVDVAPGLTVPAGSLITMSVKSRWDDIEIEYPDGAETVSRNTRDCDGCRGEIIRFILNKEGENALIFRYDNGRRRMAVTFFVSQAIEALIKKRAAFIAAHQHTDPSLWYCGLFAEWNNETGAMLGPDNYDKIGGWRIYEVSCDDPGLSKPAFLSSALVEYPVASQVEALDLYVERFVWGGLQCTEDEPYPYAIYGIPDWKQNRESEDPGLRGKLHIWRIYDYPHIALMYYNLYRIARGYPAMPLTQSAKTYLLRARDTAVAMFTVPMELQRWDARDTGLYNELCIEDIISALKNEGLGYDRLERHWDCKCRYFVTECSDLFGSEYPFDTTGFESTHILAKRGLRLAEDVLREDGKKTMMREQATRFMEAQMACNIACRGILEPAYYWYGSDYRANNTHYTLSYMSQMGGWAILDYALYHARDPFPLLRLGYGSLLSSWALVNTGYWFPGAEHDGAACGGFEPMAYGETWLDQRHSGGPWYYSCEVDLGFCGALRGAATIMADDPEFGLICYGGSMCGNNVYCEDGVRRRFHIITPTERLHITLDKGHFDGAIVFEEKRLVLRVDPCGAAGDITLTAMSESLGGIRILAADSADDEELTARITSKNGTDKVVIEWKNPLVFDNYEL